MTILFILMTLCWLITMSMYRKANKNISKLRSDNRRLKMEMEGRNANHLAVYKESQKAKRENTSNNKMGASYMDGYLIEVNDGIYLVGEDFDAYKYWENHGTVPDSYFFSFTENPFKATHYGKLETAKEHAKKCGGRVLQHKPNLEVAE